jgi:hypothetical protein
MNEFIDKNTIKLQPEANKSEEEKKEAQENKK